MCIRDRSHDVPSLCTVVAVLCVGMRIHVHCIRKSDPRLDHSAVLLLPLLASPEFINGRFAMILVARSDRTAPLQRFLASLGIHSTKSTFEELTDRLRTDALHVFCIETAEDADAFLRRYAGRQCAQQLLVVDPAMWTDDERGRALRAYAAVAMDSGFAHKFFEVFGSKMSKLVHSRRS